MASNYRIGTGISEVTDRTIGLQMQGFADERQKTTGVESSLFSRAFIVEEQGVGKRRVVIVSADIWAATNVVKQEVVKRLQKKFGTLYTSDNVLISGTHTHSAPGGYAGYIIYDITGEGFDPHTYECIVSGMVASIQKAHNNLAPGKIYVKKGDVEDRGRNRSLEAFLRNKDRDLSNATEKEMLLLKFTKLDGSGTERPVGVINWFGIHPTDRGQKNTLVCGDNKGYASTLFETSMKMDPSAPETFVAAFANAIAGDVSGNVEFKQIPNGTDDKQHMQKHGQLQYEKAKQLFDSASEALSGSIDFRHTYVDMSCVNIDGRGTGTRTWPAALGLSFAAGSREDGVPNPDVGLDEGITTSHWKLTEILMNVLATLGAKIFKGIPTALEFSAESVSGHSPKPILFALGAREGLAPKVLPIQILKIGQLVIAGFPGEITTMAGRRLRETVLVELRHMGVQHLAMAAYANDYSQYVTTGEEYAMQHYEGASNLFGPFTLDAYQQEFRNLANALRTGKQVGSGPPPPGNTSPRLSPVWRFINLSGNNVELKFYNTTDKGYPWSRADTLLNGTKTIRANTEVAFPEREFTLPLLPTVAVATVVFNRGGERTVAAGVPVTIRKDGVIDAPQVTEGGSTGGFQGVSGPVRTTDVPTLFNVRDSNSVAAVSWGANRLDIFGIGLDNAMYHRSWDGSAWLRDWENLGGAFISPPAAVSWGANRLDIIAIGLDNAMYYRAWDGSAWLRDWEGLGGAFASP
jgi:neutral ceramidase